MNAPDDSASPLTPLADVPPFYSPALARLRRCVFLASVVAVDAFATWWLWEIFRAMGIQNAHKLLIAIFALLNGLLVLGVMHALFGFFAAWSGRRHCRVRLTRLVDGQDGPLRQRHAIVMPVYQENSLKTCARIEAMYRSLEATGQLAAFDFYILSDTRDPDLWVQEEVAWANLCRTLHGFGRIYYRRRLHNDSRKAGNIANFVRSWGGLYEAMLVLDADSLLAGADMVKMARVMEAYPRLGILQTPPRLIGGVSIFTRLQQFAMSLYGPLFLRGLNFWQLGGGSYWGHNALLRLAPFSNYCDLPSLPGREPFGGRILSHDFVEAAFMVAHGWEVWLAWDMEQTYEEAPPALVDHLIRDRRWMQGNFQHFWLLFARGLCFSTRLHLFMGIMAYLSSPVWLLFLLVGTYIAWSRDQSGLSPLPYANQMEQWTGLGAGPQALLLTAFILLLLFLPKILALARALLLPSVRRSFGGATRLLLGAALETILSVLLAPILMLAHSAMVLSIFLGRAVAWGTQNRDCDGTSWRHALRAHSLTTLVGIAWAILAWKIQSPPAMETAAVAGFTGVSDELFHSPGVWRDHAFFFWMSPILLGLVFSIPVSVLTSRERYGRMLARARLLTIREENEPPEILRLWKEAHAAVDPALDASVPARRGFVAAVVDPYVNALHISLLLPDDLTSSGEALVGRCLLEGPPALTREEIVTLLCSSTALLRLHRSVWARPAEEIHPLWTAAVDSYRYRLDSVSLAT